MGRVGDDDPANIENPGLTKPSAAPSVDFTDCSELRLMERFTPRLTVMMSKAVANGIMRNQLFRERNTKAARFHIHISGRPPGGRQPIRRIGAHTPWQ